MKEKKGPLGRTVGGFAQSIAGAARRRQSDREPRALVYDAAGLPTLVDPESPAHAEMVDAAARLVALARGRRDAEEGSEDDAEIVARRLEEGGEDPDLR